MQEKYKQLLVECEGNDYTTGTTLYQILNIVCQIEGLFLHLTRNLLDEDISSKIKTNRHDIPARRALTHSFHKIYGLLHYLRRRNQSQFFSIKNVIQDTLAEYKRVNDSLKKKTVNKASIKQSKELAQFSALRSILGREIKSNTPFRKLMVKQDKKNRKRS